MGLNVSSLVGEEHQQERGVYDYPAEGGSGAFIFPKSNKFLLLQRSIRIPTQFRRLLRSQIPSPRSWLETGRSDGA